MRESMREQRRVAVACPQRRHFEHDLRQPIVQVLAKPAGGREILEILVGSADDPHVDRNFLAAADPFDHPLLQKPQQLRLQ